jgi:hypothetical protein
VLVTDPGKVIGIGAPQALFVVVMVTPVMVLAVGLIVHVRVGEHWSLVMRFMKPAANYALLVQNLEVERVCSLHHLVSGK